MTKGLENCFGMCNTQCAELLIGEPLVVFLLKEINN